MNALKVILINLDRATERLAFQQVQMQALGLEFTRVAAVDAANLTPHQDEAYWKGWERPLRSAERACFLSHLAVWHQVVKGDAPVLILEDDAVLSDKIPALLAKILDRKDLDHLTLETRGRKKMMGLKTLPELPIRRLYQDRTGSAAYVLWPTGAEKLIKRANHHPAPADAAITAAYNLRSFQADLAMAVQLDQCKLYNLQEPIHTRSTVNVPEPKKHRSNPFFLFRRLRAQLRMGIRILSHMSFTQRRQVAINHNDFAYLTNLDFSAVTTQSSVRSKS